LTPESQNYERPPLVEVAMSVQFDPPRALSQAHLGAFWSLQREDFPNIRANQPIDAVIDDFDGQWVPSSIRFSWSNEPHIRLQMSSSDDQWMCQIQRDRLVVNWRKREGVYPRFGATLERFKNAWQAFTQFAQAFEVQGIAPRTWEVTYVNRVPRSELWATALDWACVFPGLWGGRFIDIDGLSLSGASGQWAWKSTAGPSRVYAEARPGRTNDDPPQQLLMLNLTARGRVESRKNESDDFAPIEAGMHTGHELILRTFESIASEQAKEHWRKGDSN
jgi:uncharacterized protein (TIGR04255 family)